MRAEILVIERDKKRFLGIRAFFSINTYLHDIVKNRALLWSPSNGAFIVKPGKEGEVISRMIRAGVFFTNTPSLHKRVSRAFRGILRNYQREALQSWRSNGFKGIIALPTGSGKTVVGVAGICLTEMPAIVVASTVEQVRQWVEHLDRMAGIKALEIHSKTRNPEWGEISSADTVVTTYATAVRRPELVASRVVLVADEVHHLPAPKFRRIVSMSPADKIMGLSATPYREDGKHEELFPLIGGVVYKKSAEELSEMGFLSSYRVYSIPVRLTPHERMEYEWLMKKYRTLKRYRSFEDLVEDAKKGDMSAAEALRAKNRARQIALMSESKVWAIKNIVERHLRLGDKIIVFTEYLDQAERLAGELGAKLITGKTPSKQRKEIFEEFRKNPSDMLVITRVGDEGIDIPDANIGIIASGTGSARQYIQRIGRLLRPKEGKTAIVYEVFTKDTTESLEVSKRRSSSRAISNPQIDH